MGKSKSDKELEKQLDLIAKAKKKHSDILLSINSDRQNIDKYKDEKEELYNELADLHAEKESIKEIVSSEEEAFEKKKLERLAEKNKASEELGNIKKEIESSKSILSTAKNEINSTKKTIDDLSEKKHALIMDYSDLKSKCDKELSQCKEDVAKEKVELNKVKDERKEVAVQKRQMSMDLERDMNYRDLIKEEIPKLEAGFKKAKEKLASEEAKISEVESQQEDMKVATIGFNEDMKKSKQGSILEKEKLEDLIDKQIKFSEKESSLRKLQSKIKDKYLKAGIPFKDII